MNSYLLWAQRFWSRYVTVTLPLRHHIVTKINVRSRICNFLKQFTTLFNDLLHFLMRILERMEQQI